VQRDQPAPAVGGRIQLVDQMEFNVRPLEQFHLLRLGKSVDEPQDARIVGGGLAVRPEGSGALSGERRVVQHSGLVAGPLGVLDTAANWSSSMPV